MPRIIGQDSLVSRTTRFTYSPAGIAEQVTWTVPDPSPRSAPLHPTQIYSAIDAGLLALLLWFFYPFRRTDGEVIALMLTLHPISRLLLEVVRIDEPGVYGTGLTISQIVGLLMLACAILLWIGIESRPKKVAFAKAIPPSSA
jgi:phosphatidylglycerol:prolipoprotein diacylglycerol transferase